jgi:hypothetical protein
MSKGNRIRQVRGTGIQVEAIHKYNNELQDPGLGKHLWIVTGVWEVRNPTTSQFILDTENLLSIDGPGCYKCEKLYTEELATQPCIGSMELL